MAKPSGNFIALKASGMGSCTGLKAGLLMRLTVPSSQFGIFLKPVCRNLVPKKIRGSSYRRRLWAAWSSCHKSAIVCPCGLPPPSQSDARLRVDH